MILSLYRRLRHLLHPLRVLYAQWKWNVAHRWPAARLRLLAARHKNVILHTKYGGVRLIPRGSTALNWLIEGCYEPELLEFLTEETPDDGIFLDIGANAGLFAIAVATAHPSACVYAFEPAAATYQLLLANIELNKAANVRPVRVALSEHTGTATLNVNDTDKDGLNTLLPPVHPSCVIVGTETVPTIRLDDFLQDEGIRAVSIMKIDIEGAEMLALAGASRLLSQPEAPTIIFECWEGAGISAADFLVQHGYSVRDFSKDMKIAVKRAGSIAPMG